MIFVVIILFNKLRKTISVCWIRFTSQRPNAVTSTPRLRADPGTLCLLKQLIHQSCLRILAWSQRFFTRTLWVRIYGYESGKWDVVSLFDAIFTPIVFCFSLHFKSQKMSSIFAVKIDRSASVSPILLAIHSQYLYLSPVTSKMLTF